jgi:tetratricopeptide (TPR) repeat protein
MKRPSAPATVLLAGLGVTIVAVIALVEFCLIVVLPRVRVKTPLEEPANANLSIGDYNRRGNAMYEQGLYKRAATEYGHMIEKDSASVDGYLFRGMAEEKAGDHARAIADDTAGLKYARDSDYRASFLFNRGLARRNSGDYKAAIPDFSQAIALQPNNGPAYEIRAFCYTNLGDFDRAISDYTVAIGYDPHPGTVFERGQAYLKKNEYQKALADLNRSLATRPNFLAGYVLRAEAHSHLQEFDQAVTDAEAALRLDRSAVNLANLGWYQYLAGKLPEAIENTQAAAKMDGASVVARLNLGLFYAVQGNTAAMTTAYQEALRPAKAGDLRSALQDVKTAQKKQPNAPALQQAEALLQNALRSAAATS